MSKIKVLIIVDMQNDFIDGALGTPEAQAIVPNVVQRLKNIDIDTAVIYTRDTHSEDYLNTHEGKLLPIPHCIFGTHGWELNEEIEKIYSDHFFINKETFGSFELLNEISNTMFEYGLEDNEVEIEFCGLCTDICVISNAILAKNFFPESEIIVNAKCCAGTTPENHINALNAMKMCQITIQED